ncbi:MazG-like family protein [Dendrosporobacter sp. 1207_IL3150]|uniref:MazG-like family protein n=1 Tax=Dendrosporobacter sp. 1207_IL3150 TaxID=3084054 RepID=UPI002FD98E46
MFSHESEILRKMRLIEWLKAELVANVGQLYQAMAKNSEQAIKDGLANVIISCFILGRRLGINFADLDEAIITRLNQNIKRENDVEKWFGDFSEYQRHLRNKR